MNGRTRIESAFSPEGTAEFAAVIPYEGIFIRDHWESLSTQPWWVRIVPDNDTQFTWRKQIAARLGQDWFDLPSGIAQDTQDNISILEKGNEVYWVDRRDRSWQKLTPPRISGWSDTDNASVHPLHPPETEEEVESWIQGWTVPGQGLQSHLHNLPHRILRAWGRSLYPMGYINAPLWSCYYMWGFEGLMTRIIDKPDLVEFAVLRFTESTLNQIKLYESIGSLGLWLEDCMTDMISASHFHKINLPYLRVITEVAHSYKQRVFHYFCGDPTGKWDDLLNTGADALSLEESKKGFDINIEDVVELVNGRMVVLGNLDAVGILEKASEYVLHAEIDRQLKAGKKNNHRFIMSLGSPVTPDTTVNRLIQYIEMTHALGRR